MRGGVNKSEEFVYGVCQRSFLSLWSYANPQGRKPGKELCDILVVCDPHVLVICVADVLLSQSGDMEVGWERWQRKVVDHSAKQIRGALRYLHGAEYVVANDGTRGLPLPPLDRRVYHRIAVAFGGRRQIPLAGSKEEFGGILHLLDEQSFYLLLRHLDTISDFVQYLTDKEELLSRAAVIITGGEENLLAMYLRNGRRFPPGVDVLTLEDDLWDGFSSQSEFLSKLEQDHDSYVWDHLIEMMCTGGFDTPTWRGPGVAESERALRVLAMEDRFSRRVLGRAFREFLELSKVGRVRSRFIKSLNQVGYVFSTYDSSQPVENRPRELQGRCFASLCHHPECSTIIGIGINVPGESPRGGYSTDLVMLHTEDGTWPEQYIEIGRVFRDRLGYFKTPSETHIHEDEYPPAPQSKGSQDRD